MQIYVYNESTNRIEKYTKTLGSVMPYIKNKYLTVKEFRGSSKSELLWTTKSTMEAFNTTRERFNAGIYVGYAFKRIFEGGHSGQSQHYAGTAFDCGQTWSVSKRRDFYNLCRKINVWGYVEPINLTPSWVHIDKRKNPPACSAGYPLLKYNTTSNYVLILQDALIYLGHNIQLDGIFGTKTKKAVTEFQRKYNLSADGIVGCNTWTKLVSLVVGKGANSKVKYY